MHHRLRSSLAAGAIALALGSSLAPVGAAPASRPAHAALFSSPTGLAFDLYRNAYVTDSSGKIVKLSPLAHVLNTFGASGQLRNPRSVTADARGHIFVVDGGDSAVHVFSYAGKPAGRFGGRGTLRLPSAAAIDAGGNVYVADTGHGRIVKFSSAGKLLAVYNGVNGTRPKLAPPKIGKHGKKIYPKPIKVVYSGRFNNPQGVTVDFAGHVWVADTGHDRVIEMTHTGLPIRIIRGALSHPLALAVGARGSIWIVDNGHNRVLELSAGGSVLRTLGGVKGSAAGQFNDPRDVALDGRGNVYVVDTGNARVQKFSASGQSLGAWQ